MDFPALIAKAAETTNEVVQGVDPAQFSGPTPCAEFDVKALAEHITRVTAMSVSAARKAGFTPTEFDAATFKGRYAADISNLTSAWSEPGALEGSTPFGSGERPAEFVAAITLSELVLHGWDLARATGQTMNTDGDVAQATHQMMIQGAEGGREAGAYGAEVTVADDASPLDKALGLSGRDPTWSA